jgi:hypothetical protein
LNEYGKKNSKHSEKKNRRFKNNDYYDNNDDESQYDLRSEPINNNNYKNDQYQEETSSLPPIISKNTDHIVDRNQKSKEDRINKVTSAPPRLSLPPHNVRNSHEGYGKGDKQRPHVFQRKR